MGRRRFNNRSLSSVSERGGKHMCNCWVSREPWEVQFAIRYGAHNPQCPRYRPSRDPVDAINDTEIRLHAETGIGN